MMDRYQVADNPYGPWIELEVTNNPHFALQKARASFGWSVVWVAKMRPLMGKDMLPTAGVFWGDVKERVFAVAGSQVVDELETQIEMDDISAVEDALTGILLDCEVDILVPDIKKPYGRDQEVRATDFLPQKPKLKELV